MSKVKILCLHGTHTSGEIFRTQLGQLATRLEQEQNLELVFIDGLIQTECHESMRGMFQGPYYSWFPLRSEKEMIDYESAKQALDFVEEIIEEEGPFDGIMGFSQGAALALALMLRRSVEHPLDSPHVICKYVILLSCVGTKDIQSQWDTKLTIPTLHVLDMGDKMIGPRASVTVCDPRSSKLLRHDRGHSVPRDEATANSIFAAIQELQHRAVVF